MPDGGRPHGVAPTEPRRRAGPTRQIRTCVLAWCSPLCQPGADVRFVILVVVIERATHDRRAEPPIAQPGEATRLEQVVVRHEFDRSLDAIECFARLAQDL